MSSLVSAVRRLPNQMRVLGDSLYHLFKNYSDLGHNSQKLWRAWRDGGTYRLKYTLLSLRPPASPTSNWQHYQQRLSSELLPALQAKVLALDHPTPTIAVVVPTYNTNANNRIPAKNVAFYTSSLQRRTVRLVPVILTKFVFVFVFDKISNIYDIRYITEDVFLDTLFRVWLSAQYKSRRCQLLLCA